MSWHFTQPICSAWSLCGIFLPKARTVTGGTFTPTLEWQRVAQYPPEISGDSDQENSAWVMPRRPSTSPSCGARW